MSNLLIDIGNSDIKIGSGNAENHLVRLMKRSPYSKNNFERDFRTIMEDITGKFTFEKAGISILKNSDEMFLKKYFKRSLNIAPVFISRNLRLPIKINYTNGIGNDRICNAVAAAEIYKARNILVIDFGTATTYTLITNNNLTGGMISPGIKTSLNSLTGSTSLPNIELKFPKKLINNNTIDNIKAGVLYQSLFSVERVISELIKSSGELFVIATGGYSKLLSKRTVLINEVDKNLVLKGINIILSQ